MKEQEQKIDPKNTYDFTKFKTIQVFRYAIRFNYNVFGKR